MLSEGKKTQMFCAGIIFTIVVIGVVGVGYWVYEPLDEEIKEERDEDI